MLCWFQYRYCHLLVCHYRFSCIKFLNCWLFQMLCSKKRWQKKRKPQLRFELSSCVNQFKKYFRFSFAPYHAFLNEKHCILLPKLRELIWDYVVHPRLKLLIQFQSRQILLTVYLRNRFQPPSASSPSQKFSLNQVVPSSKPSLVTKLG